MCLVKVQQRPSPKSTNSRTSYPFLLAPPLHGRDNGMMCPEMGDVKSTIETFLAYVKDPLGLHHATSIIKIQPFVMFHLVELQKIEL